jgi:hypothetical protein
MHHSRGVTTTIDKMSNSPEHAKRGGKKPKAKRSWDHQDVFRTWSCRMPEASAKGGMQVAGSPNTERTSPRIQDFWE